MIASPKLKATTIVRRIVTMDEGYVAKSETSKPLCRLIPPRA